MSGASTPCSVCVRRLLSVLTYSSSEGSHNFKMYICILGKEKLHSFYMEGMFPSFSSPSVSCLLSPLPSLQFFHFSLHSSIAASFSVLPVIYFCPSIYIVLSTSSEVVYIPLHISSKPLPCFSLLPFRTRVMGF